MEPIILATNNKYKIHEVSALLGSSVLLKGLSDIGCFEELPETHDTIRENSLEKAQYVFDRYHVSCFADDSGLEVEALNGEPGVYSAMYAGPQRNFDDNIALLLKKLSGIENRKALFRTIITLVEPTGINHFEGICRGTILHEKRGKQGFGYDPVFIPAGHHRTFAEMSPDEKNKISHRSIAIRKLADYLTLKYGS